MKPNPPQSPPKCPHCDRPMVQADRLGMQGWTCRSCRYARVRTGGKRGNQDQD